MKSKINLIWRLDPDDPRIWERDWLSYLLSSYETEHIVDLHNDVVTDHAIVVTSGASARGGDMGSYLRRFRTAGHTVGVFHLSDEARTSPISFYKHAAFVYRNYYRPEAQLRKNCRYFGLGYKSGFTEGLTPRPMDERQYRWSFAGQVKSSREAMLEAASRIPGGHTHITQSFTDPHGLDVSSYADLLSDTIFALCPRGNVSLDCFRVYEALEAGAIPVIEDGGITQIREDLRHRKAFLRNSAWRAAYWRGNIPRAFSGSYWLAAFGDDFPCPRVQSWSDLERSLAAVDVSSASRAVQDWWSGYKRSLTLRLCGDVDNLLLG